MGKISVAGGGSGTDVSIASNESGSANLSLSIPDFLGAVLNTDDDAFSVVGLEGKLGPAVVAGHVEVTDDSVDVTVGGGFGFFGEATVSFGFDGTIDFGWSDAGFSYGFGGTIDFAGFTAGAEIGVTDSAVDGLAFGARAEAIAFGFAAEFSPNMDGDGGLSGSAGSTPGTNDGEASEGTDGIGVGDQGLGSGRGGLPIVIDLDDDGIELVGKNVSPSSFDFDSDNYRERTAWVTPSDALLVLDLASDGSSGADGKINLARELAFAEWTTEVGTDTDMQAFAAFFDKNNDGKFDLTDFDFNQRISVEGQSYKWSDFRLWQDFDLDGVVDLSLGELRTLDGKAIIDADSDGVADGIAAERGVGVRAITSIGLRHEDENGQLIAYTDTSDDVTIDGNTLHGSATYSYLVTEYDAGASSGQSTSSGEGLVGDVSLAYYANGVRQVDTTDGFAIELEGEGYAHFIDIAKQKNVYEAEISDSVNLVNLGLFGVLGDNFAQNLTASGAEYGVVLQGGGGDDTLGGGNAADLISGDAGADQLRGRGNHTDIFGYLASAIRDVRFKVPLAQSAA